MACQWLPGGVRDDESPVRRSGLGKTIRPRTGFPFQYYFCQREAVETFVFLHEVRRVRGFIGLMPFASEPVMVDPAGAGAARYVFKMATGLGEDEGDGAMRGVVVLPRASGSRTRR